MALPIRRPGSGSGGFLNGVAVTINAATFEANKSGKTKKGNNYTAYSVKVNVTPDGGQPVDQFFNGGFLYGDNVVSKDKRSIEGKDDYFVDADTEWGKFVVSLFEGDGARLSDDVGGDLRSLAFLDKLRFTGKRVIDREATIAAGERALAKKLNSTVKAKAATEEEKIAAGKRVDKKDKSKSYMLDQLLVGEVLGSAAPAGAKKTAAKPAAAAAAPAAAAEPGLADTVLREVINGAGGQIERAKFSPAFLRYAAAQKMTTDTREPLRKLLISDEYVNGAVERGVIVLDGEGKTATLIVNPVEEAATA
jgi:hypothetical protein